MERESGEVCTLGPCIYLLVDIGAIEKGEEKG